MFYGVVYEDDVDCIFVVVGCFDWCGIGFGILVDVGV